MEDGRIDTDGDEDEKEQGGQNADDDDDEEFPAPLVTAAVVAAAVGLVLVASLVAYICGPLVHQLPAVGDALSSFHLVRGQVEFQVVLCLFLSVSFCPSLSLSLFVRLSVARVCGHLVHHLTNVGD